MPTLSETHPAVAVIYFFAVAGIAMFTLNPILLSLSLFGALLFFLLQNGRGYAKTHLLFFGVFACTVLLNPLFSHSGETVWLVINHKPITKEAFLYGVTVATSVLAVLYWSRSFSQIMTSDKLLCVCAFLSPRLALLLSMSLRYLPLLGKKAREVRDAQRGVGLYRDDSLFHAAKGGARVWSGLLTWTLENGIVTADSMAARGYGERRRTLFPRYRFRRADLFLLLLTVAFTVPVLTVFVQGSLTCEFYPRLILAQPSWQALVGYACYGALAVMPAILEIKEAVRWSYLKSKI